MSDSILEQFPAELDDETAKYLLRVGDSEAVILGTMREAIRYSRKCCRGGIDDGELISLCYDAMKGAARKYNPKYGISFFAHCKAYIRGEIARHWKKRGKSDEEFDDEGEARPRFATEADTLDFDTIDMKERLAIVWPIVEKRLNEAELMVVVLRYRSGFSFEEIGRLRGVTRQAIQRTHLQAVAKIRHAIAHKKNL